MNDVFTTPWAIEEKSLSALVAQADRFHLEVASPGQVRRRSSNMTEQNKVAVIQVHGPMFTHHNFFVDLLGGTVLDDLDADIKAAVGDKTIKGILLSVDSGGGQINGLAELSRTIREARSKKPIAAYISGSGASGAYWIASAASRIYASETAILGSIGVVSTYIDRSEQNERAGVKVIETISSMSPRKRLTPTNDEGREEEQRLVDSLAQVFINAVAENRNTTPERVISDFGGGGVLVGQKAVDVGLADGLGSFEEVLASLSAGKLPEPQKQTRKADFMGMVAAHQAAHGSTLGEAMLAVARTNPEAYEAHEFGPQEQAQDEPQTTSREQPQGGDSRWFENLVVTLRESRGLTRDQALMAAARRAPEAYRRFMENGLAG